MTIVRSISPEAKALYKMRRENLKQLSRILQLQMKSGAADFDSVNEGLIQIYSSDGVHIAFKTFQQWKEEGKSVIKGEKAFSVWAVPEKLPILSLKKAKMMNLSTGRFATFSVMPRCMSRSILSESSCKHSAPMDFPSEFINARSE